MSEIRKKTIEVHEWDFGSESKFILSDRIHFWVEKGQWGIGNEKLKIHSEGIGHKLWFYDSESEVDWASVVVGVCSAKKKFLYCNIECDVFIEDDDDDRWI